MRACIVEMKEKGKSGFISMGISKDAYKEIMSLYKTNDVVISHLVSQKRV